MNLDNNMKFNSHK